MLDKSEKEKHAMYVQDLYAILHALWVNDTKPLHGLVRVQISLLLLLSAATATRPGAIVESASAKGSNKALSFKHIEILKRFHMRKYRDIFVRLGRVAGFEKSLELYQLRRASGRNINSALDSVERNQTMGHLGSTYEKYYTPTHIARDFQSIYFGSPSEDLLIESVARMGLSRDRRAPTELNDAQQEELRNDPALAVLRKERETYKGQLHDQGFQPLLKGQGTNLYKKYEDTKRKLSSTYQRLYRERLDSVYNQFHESIDTIEIARQLSGKAAAEILTLPAPKAFKRKKVGLLACEANGSSFSNKRKKGTNGFEKSPLNQACEIVKEELDAPRAKTSWR
ncbi:hypothetical protein EJ07DRAFT_186564 [Lizonia empirigonia]|nr:hypothetical protein EJ07DRAFT_186564 [Lizonia empirigonia]